MTQPDFRDKFFWKKLREETRVHNRLGVEECWYWCSDVLGLLNYGNHGFRKINGSVSPREQTEYRLFVNSHWFLYRIFPDGIFIADGTAGQEARRYPLGYYGYLQDAPLPITLFYRSGLRQSLGDHRRI